MVKLSLSVLLAHFKANERMPSKTFKPRAVISVFFANRVSLFPFLCGEEVHQGSKTFAAKFVYTLNVMAWYVRNMKKQIEEKRKGKQKAI